ncbi:MAG: serine hydrolase domain-containing protein [Flavobacteriaceae bacterium]
MRIMYGFFISIGLLLAACQDDGPIPMESTGFDEGQALERGLNPDSLKQAIRNASNLPNFYGLLVVKDNELVVEEYFNGKTANDHYHLRSITKNFTSALTGIAIEEGLIDSLDLPVTAHFSDLDVSKEAITIKHLLNMTSGLQWNEGNEVIPLIEHRIQMPVNNYLSRTLTSSPGSSYNYSSVSPHVVATLISDRTNGSYATYATDKLFSPLGIANFKWEKDPQGNEWGGFGLQLLPADLVKFGQLYLNKGDWNNLPVVPNNWVELSQSAQITIPNSSTAYSLQWYVADNLKYKVYYGQGFGGQALMLIPGKNMMIIGLQEYLVSFQQSRIQWNGFLKEVFNPVYGALN